MPDALMVGATGMVGRAVIGHFGSTSVTVLARREVESLAPHHRELVAPSERWADIIAACDPACRIVVPWQEMRTAGLSAAMLSAQRSDGATSSR